MTPTAKILLLGSGELGREFVISAKRLGCKVIACDSYAHAPAMQVADGCEVFSMLDADALADAITRHAPDLVVPVTGDHHHLVDPGRAEQADAQTKRGLCPLRVERQERLEPAHARTQAGRQHQRAQARCHALRPVARW